MAIVDSISVCGTRISIKGLILTRKGMTEDMHDSRLRDNASHTLLPVQSLLFLGESFQQSEYFERPSHSGRSAPHKTLTL